MEIFLTFTEDLNISSNCLTEFCQIVQWIGYNLDNWSANWAVDTSSVGLKSSADKSLVNWLKFDDIFLLSQKKQNKNSVWTQIQNQR